MLFLVFLLSRLTGKGNSHILCASGDIHGDLRVVQEIENLVIEHKCDELVLTGDFVDRGFQSMEVLREVKKWVTEGERGMYTKVFPLLGNHETQCLMGIDVNQTSSNFDAWEGRDNWLKVWDVGGEARELVDKFQMYHLYKPDNCSQSRNPTTLFMHSGVELSVTNGNTGQPFNTMEELQTEVLKFVHTPKAWDKNNNWKNEMYSQAMETRVYHRDTKDLCANVHKLLEFSGAARLVIGHNSAGRRGLLTMCDDAIYFIDIGMGANHSGFESMGALLVIKTELDMHGNESVASIKSYVKYPGKLSELDQTIVKKTSLANRLRNALLNVYKRRTNSGYQSRDDKKTRDSNISFISVN